MRCCARSGRTSRARSPGSTGAETSTATGSSSTCGARRAGSSAYRLSFLGSLLFLAGLILDFLLRTVVGRPDTALTNLRRDSAEAVLVVSPAPDTMHTLGSGRVHPGGSLFTSALIPPEPAVVSVEAKHPRLRNLFGRSRFGVRPPAALTALEASAGLVPVLWHYEMRNVLLVAHRRKRISAEAMAERVAALSDLPVETDHEPDLAAALALAGRHGLSCYDGLYLELACRRRAALATLDDRLLGAARAEGVAAGG